MGVEIQWWGTAAFRIRFNQTTVLLDPYVTRNPYAEKLPEIDPLKLADNADHVLLSHGHFDHVFDVPEMLRQNPLLRLHGPEAALTTVRRLGGQGTSMQQGRIKISDDVSADVLPSKHVHFNFGLILKTGLRSIFTKATYTHLRPSLLTAYPCGETVAYLLTFRHGDSKPFRVMFLGSAGPTNETLDQWARVHKRVDCLLVPLQGNSKICEIGANVVARLRPRFVIPHHHDDYFPPLSKRIDIAPFKKLVAEKAPQTTVLELELGGAQTFDLEKGLGSHAERSPDAAPSLE